MDSLSGTTYTPSKIFYMNGMTSSLEWATADRIRLEKVTQAKVELMHNDTTPISALAIAITELAVGTLCLAMATKEKLSSEKRILCIAFGILFLTLGFKKVAEIEARKNAKAKELADKIARYLDANPCKEALLVLHSQGADIGLRALGHLSRQQARRLSVATVGGQLHIPPDLAKRVKNIHANEDIIAGIGRTFFGIGPVDPTPTIASCGSLGCHSVAGYLKDRNVRKILRELAFA